MVRELIGKIFLKRDSGVTIWKKVRILYSKMLSSLKKIISYLFGGEPVVPPKEEAAWDKRLFLPSIGKQYAAFCQALWEKAQKEENLLCEKVSEIRRELESHDEKTLDGELLRRELKKKLSLAEKAKEECIEKIFYAPARREFQRLKNQVLELLFSLSPILVTEGFDEVTRNLVKREFRLNPETGEILLSEYIRRPIFKETGVKRFVPRGYDIRAGNHKWEDHWVDLVTLVGHEEEWIPVFNGENISPIVLEKMEERDLLALKKKFSS